MPRREHQLKRFWPFFLFPSLKLFIQLFAIPGYGIFRDELYYIACSERLALGYVDHPPLSIFLLRLVREALGDSLWALRLVPALVGAATVLLVGLIALRMGGGKLAQALAMASTLAVPYYLGIHHLYSMNSLDVFLWTFAAYLLTRLAEQNDLRTWYLLGAVLGLGLLNKLSVLWFGFGLAAGLILTEQRRTFKTPGPWVAAGLAFALFLPHVIWQIRLGWPTLEFIANATGEKMVKVAPIDFALGQMMLLGGPATVAIVLLGLGVLMASPSHRKFRLLGWIYIAVFLLLMVNGTSRSGYLAPAYTWLLAAGGLGCERLVASVHRPGWRLAAAALPFVLVIGQGAAVAPLGLPILPIDTYITYSRALGVTPSTAEKKELAELPQHFADMHGWQEKAAAARRVVEGLSPEDRAVACLFATNYGVAGALEHLGQQAGVDDLPPVLSGHNNYYLWGPGDCTGEVMVVLGGDGEGLRQMFESVEYVATVDCGRCMPYENQQPIFVARRLLGELDGLWEELKHFD